MARVDTGSQAGYAVSLGDLVQLSSQFRILSSRISHFFSRSDYVDSLLHDEFQLRESVLSERIGAEQNDVSSARFDEVLSGLDLNVRSVSSFSLDIIVH